MLDTDIFYYAFTVTVVVQSTNCKTERTLRYVCLEECFVSLGNDISTCTSILLPCYRNALLALVIFSQNPARMYH